MKEAAIAECKSDQESVRQMKAEHTVNLQRGFRERLRDESGYTEEELEIMLNKGKRKGMERWRMNKNVRSKTMRKESHGLRYVVSRIYQFDAS